MKTYTANPDVAGVTVGWGDNAFRFCAEGVRYRFGPIPLATAEDLEFHVYKTLPHRHTAKTKLRVVTFRFGPGGNEPRMTSHSLVEVQTPTGKWSFTNLPSAVGGRMRIMLRVDGFDVSKPLYATMTFKRGRALWLS